MLKNILKKYLKNLLKTAGRGDAREESYYEHLSSLIKEIAETQKVKNVDVTILPKKTEAGNPDFRVWDGKNHITGYIEAKDPSMTNLDNIENSEQLKRYCSTFPNVILTNFYEFRLYRNGERISQVTIARPFIANKLKIEQSLEKIEQFTQLFELFFSFSLPKVRTAKTLALELAKRTRFLRDEVVSLELEENESKGHKQIIAFYEAFKKYLISTLSKKQFADLYSQTITYGLFSSRTRADEEFNRELAFKYIPNTIGILRDVFRFISLEDPPKSLQIIVDDISEILKVTDVKKILQDYYKEGKGKDPIIHFYETFLSAYDPSVREKRGVYYTPEPIVKYIVRSIHTILKTHFNLADGLASEEVKLLDPAGGTLTFPAEAIKIAKEEYENKYGSGGLHNWIKKHILKNYYAFELMMAPYAIGHLKMSFILDEIGYKLADDERFKLYLTNTLEMEEIDQSSLPGLSSLSEESHLAGKVKKEQPVLVILGNPPYSYDSPNKNDWTEKLLKNNIDGCQNYYSIDDQPLSEKNPKGLQDDYVKFLRFAQWKINKAGFGIVGMITNHSYLDNPTFRGMRQSLLKTFNKIFILDLHGNSKKKETTPAGGKDENVFDIIQGTSIVFFIKEKNVEGCTIKHKDLYGLRDAKYEWLALNKFDEQNYCEIKPESPWYFYIPRKTQHIKHYLNWKNILEIFPRHNAGLYTSRDKLTIKWSSQEMWNTVLNFSKLDPEIAREAYDIGKDSGDWKITWAQKDILKNGPVREKIFPILYRPFDERYIYYTGYSNGLICRPRSEIMQHMLQENIGLTIGRQGQVVGLDQLWNLAFITTNIVDYNLYYRGGELLFPLYIYADKSKQDLFSHLQADKEANISKEIINALNTAFSKEPSPEEILYYIYAVFYSNMYREKYAEFLKIDFPRVPFTSNFELFITLGKLGKRLADMHLLKGNELDMPVAKYQGNGSDDRIVKIIYKEDEQRVHLNDDKYFEGIAPEVWNYHIGGYQVLQKYLKDRKGRVMEKSKRYCRIVTALSKTIEIQKEIDLLYPDVEKKMIE